MNVKAMSTEALKQWEIDLRNLINKTGADYSTAQGTKLIDAYYSIKLELDSRA